MFACLLGGLFAQVKTSSDSTHGVIKVSKPTDSVASDFSPNGDGIKDVFVFSTTSISRVTVVVVDATGNIIFQALHYY